MQFILLVLLLFNTSLCNEIENQSDDVLDLIKSDGYNGQRYQVETKDEYLLVLHRISLQNETSSKPPVFLMHGLFANSFDYLMTGPKIAMAYLLADNGYDVWIGNSRGGKFSMKHKTLSSESEEFWDYSFHEIGFYDLPAMIDYMLNETKSSKAFYVGHSQGSTSFLVFLSTRPEYSDKILQAHLLAPAAFMKRNKTPKFLEVLGEEVANGLLNDYKYLNFESFFGLGETLSQFLCIEQRVEICDKIYFAAFGRNKNGAKVDSVNCFKS